MKLWNWTREAIGALLLMLAAVCAHATTFPERPVTVVSPFAAGGAVDVIARMVAPKVSAEIGVPVIVVNKTGGGGMVGSDFVARAEPDGYTVLIQGTAPLAINAAAKRKIGFDPQKDLKPVAMITVMPHLVAVTPSLPVHSIAELVAHAKAHPGRLNYGMSGIGNIAHLNAERLKKMAGINMVGVPYQGAAPMLTDLVAGRVQVTFENLAPLLPFAKSGKIRPLAVTGQTRSALLPDVPTLQELGFDGFDSKGLFAVFAPAGTADDRIEKLQNAFLKAVREPDVVASLAKLAVSPAPGDAATLARQMRGDIETFRAIMTDANIKID